MIIQLRKNASQKSIDQAIETLMNEWNKSNKNPAILFYENGYPVYERTGTYYLQIGDTIRWGCDGNFWQWGFSEKEIDSGIAGQKEYEYSRK